MPNIGPMELAIVLVIALLILGPKKLPDVGRSVGRGLREFKDSVVRPRRRRRARPRPGRSPPRDGLSAGRRHGHDALRRPVARRRARCSVVGHLDELRSRLIVCLVALTVAFGICLWQNDALLTSSTARSTTQTQKQIAKGEGPLGETRRRSTPRSPSRAPTGPTAAALAAPGSGLSDAGAGGDAGARRRARPDDAGLPRRRRQQAGDPRHRRALLDDADGRRDVRADPVAAADPLPARTRSSCPRSRPRERRAAIPLLVMVPALFAAASRSATSLVLPAAIRFLQNFNTDEFNVLVQARDYYKFVAMTLLAIGHRLPDPGRHPRPHAARRGQRRAAAPPPPLRDRRCAAVAMAAAGHRPGDDAHRDGPARPALEVSVLLAALFAAGARPPARLDGGDGPRPRGTRAPGCRNIPAPMAVALATVAARMGPDRHDRLRRPARARRAPARAVRRAARAGSTPTSSRTPSPPATCCPARPRRSSRSTARWRVARPLGRARRRPRLHPPGPARRSSRSPALFLAGVAARLAARRGAGAGAAVAAVAVRAGLALAPRSWLRATADRRRWSPTSSLGARRRGDRRRARASCSPCWPAGCVEMASAPPRRAGIARRHAWPVRSRPPAVSAALAWTALKVGALSYGGGFVIIPLMQADAVDRYHWMTDAAVPQRGRARPDHAGPGRAHGRGRRLRGGRPRRGAAGGGGRVRAVVRRSSSLGARALRPRCAATRRARAFLDGAGPAAIGAILGSAVVAARRRPPRVAVGAPRPRRRRAAPRPQADRGAAHRVRRGDRAVGAGRSRLGLGSADGRPPGRDDRPPPAPAALRHGQPARQRAARPRSTSRPCSSAAGFEVELLGRTAERPNLIARLRGRGGRARRSARSPTSTPSYASPEPLAARPVVGRTSPTAASVGPRRDRHEEPDGRRGRRRLSLAREGWRPAAATCSYRRARRRGDRRGRGRAVDLPPSTPTRSAATSCSTRAPAIIPFDGRRHTTASASPRRASSASR